MTKTIKSETSNKHYFLTIDDETQHATDCACPDRAYRHHTCKHMRHFDAEVERAATFLALKEQYDVRGSVQQARRFYFEMSIGA